MSFPFSQENSESSSEVSTIVEGRLDSSGRIIVEQTKFQDELRTRGFGDSEEQSQYLLRPYEGLYLLYRNRLTLINAKDATLESLLDLFTKTDIDIMTNFLIYRDLRSRGYIAKEGFGFGNDFRVYERGEFQKKPAKYVVFGISEGANMKATMLAAAVAQVEKMGKEAIVAVIERRGEVIYYKVSKMRFGENKSTR